MENENGTVNKKEDTKLCKHCQSEIPKKAKVCPNCRKKQGGIGKWIVIVVVVLLIFAGASGSEDGTDSTTNVNEVSQDTAATDGAKADTDNDSVSESSEDAAEATDAATEENNEFVVGDVVETDSLKITYISAGEYTDEYLTAKDGHVYFRMEFEIENISDVDQVVSSWSWVCYADGYAVDETYIGDDIISATLSPGKKVKGSIYYEVPVDAQEIIAEYETNFWTQGKIVFVGK